MTRLGIVLTASLGLASTFAPARLIAQDVGVTGAAEATLPPGAIFNGIPLKGLTLGQGIFIGQDGSATGQFQAVLRGTTLLGSARNIVVEGEVSNGSADGGTATFSGTASVNLGNGTPALAGVPFTVTASGGSLGLTLNGAALPTATVSAGSITIEWVRELSSTTFPANLDGNHGGVQISHGDVIPDEGYDGWVDVFTIGKDINGTSGQSLNSTITYDFQKP